MCTIRTVVKYTVLTATLRYGIICSFHRVSTVLVLPGSIPEILVAPPVVDIHGNTELIDAPVAEGAILQRRSTMAGVCPEAKHAGLVPPSVVDRSS